MYDLLGYIFGWDTGLFENMEYDGEKNYQNSLLRKSPLKMCPN